MKKLLKWIALIFIALIVIGFLVGGNENNTQQNTQEAISTPAQADIVPSEPPLETTANELLQAYKDNEIAANQKFKDKVLLIKASIESIDADFSDKPVLKLKAGGEFEFNQPQALLADNALEQASQLKKGQKIVLRCIGASEVAGTPMLRECTIEQ